MTAPDLSPDLDPHEFERRLRELGRRRDVELNDECVECRDCTGCAHCTFCVDSERLAGCHYCTACESCLDCSHCRGSTRLIGCHHCLESEDCSACRYVVLSSALSNCSYCFGCVGLRNKTFYILNEPYTQQDYFRLTARLSRALELR